MLLMCLFVFTGCSEKCTKNHTIDRRSFFTFFLLPQKDKVLKLDIIRLPHLHTTNEHTKAYLSRMSSDEIKRLKNKSRPRWDGDVRGEELAECSGPEFFTNQLLLLLLSTVEDTVRTAGIIPIIVSEPAETIAVGRSPIITESSQGCLNTFPHSVNNGGNRSAMI